MLLHQPALRRALASVLPGLVLVTAALAAPSPDRDAEPALRLVGVTIGNSGNQQVATDAHGNAIATWYRVIDDLFWVEARYKPVGGAWGDVKVLTSGASQLISPRVAMNAAGSAVVVWGRDLGGVKRVQVARRSPAGNWSAVQLLSPDGVSAEDARVAIDGNGNAVAAWDVPVDGFTRVQASRQPAGGSWSAPATLSPAGENAGSPELAMGPDGDTTLVWRTVGAESRIKSVRRPAGAGWGSVLPLTPVGELAFNPAVATGANGNATAAWTASVSGHNVVQAKVRGSQGWGTVKTLSPADLDAGDPHVAMTPAGQSFVVFPVIENAKWRAQVIRRPAGGAWGSRVKLSARGQSSQWVRVAANRDGDAVAIWSVVGEGVIEASSRPHGGSWGIAEDVSETGRTSGAPEIALSDQGSATAAFWAQDATLVRIQAARRSPSGTWLDPVFISTLF